MGTGTEERLKAITADAAQQAARESARLVYEQFYPVMIKRDSGLGKIWAWFKGALKHAAETADRTRIE